MNTFNVSDIHTAFSYLGKSAKKTAARMLVLQGEWLCVKHQLPVSFYDQGRQNDDRQLYQDRINFSLHSLSDHRCFYENTLMPEINRQINDVDRYFNAQNALGEVLSSGLDTRQALQQLKSIQERAMLYSAQASAVTVELERFRHSLGNEACQCDATTKNLNAVMNGDRNILSTICNQLAGLDAKISRTTADSMEEALAQPGARVIMTIGNIAELFTTSRPTPLVLGSAGITCKGVEAEITDTVHLASLLNQKSEILNHGTGLHSEVMLSLSITSGLNKLSSDAKALLDSIQFMVSCWNALVQQLGDLIQRVEKGEMSIDAISRLLISAAKGDIYYIQQDIENILAQLITIDVIEEPLKSVTSLIVGNIQPSSTACSEAVYRVVPSSTTGVGWYH